MWSVHREEICRSPFAYLLLAQFWQEACGWELMLQECCRRTEGNLCPAHIDLRAGGKEKKAKNISWQENRKANCQQLKTKDQRILFWSFLLNCWHYALLSHLDTMSSLGRRKNTVLIKNQNITNYNIAMC